MSNYSESDILLHVGSRALEAGRIYQKQRRVLEFANGGDSISAKVQGNERQPYKQDIDVKRAATGKVTIRSDCSCPIGESCKHVAAALLEGLARPRSYAVAQQSSASGARSSPAAPTLPPELAAWLESLERARRDSEEGYPADQRQRIVYVLAHKTSRPASRGSS